MMLMEQKAKLLQDIESNIRYKISSELNGISLDNGIYSVRTAIERAVIVGVREAISQLIDKTYLTQDFEKDIGLRS